MCLARDDYLVLNVAVKVVGEETAAAAGCGAQGDGVQHLAGGGSGHEGCT